MDPTSRRDFLIKSGAAAAALGIASLAENASAQTLVLPGAPVSAGDASIKDLALLGVDAAKKAGAQYADVRIAQNRSQRIFTREHRVQALDDSETFGIGVRVLANGAWGFAAGRELTKDQVLALVKRAMAQAQANRTALVRPVVLAPVTPTPNGTWNTPIEIDPFSVAIEDKVALLLAANDAALKVQGARFVTSGMFFLREEKTLATSDGTFVVQTIYRTQPTMTVTAVAPDFSDFQSRQSTDVQPMGLGYEHVRDAKLLENAPRWAGEAVQKLSAKPVEVGKYDLVLHPTHLWLTIHESIAHPTELDRAMGYEANYAGTSFVSPPDKMLGQFRYGPEIMNIQGDRKQPGSLGAIGWDDEGVAPDTFLVIKKGIVNDYQTTREQALWLEWWYKKQGLETRSHGCSYSQSWSDVQFQRMPNISLLPGEKEQSWDDLIAATDRGIAIMGEGSFSIDQQRYNAQFGGQLFYEIKGGKITGMLKDVAYQMRTPEFWNSMDMIGGQSSYFLGGAFNDGKGQPSQSNAVSHGCVPSRFKQINVINTGRKANS
jgi:TldD protein